MTPIPASREAACRLPLWLARGKNVRQLLALFLFQSLSVVTSVVVLLGGCLLIDCRPPRWILFAPSLLATHCSMRCKFPPSRNRASKEEILELVKKSLALGPIVVVDGTFQRNQFQKSFGFGPPILLSKEHQSKHMGYHQAQ
jgi:hypothetical protein